MRKSPFVLLMVVGGCLGLGLVGQAGSLLQAPSDQVQEVDARTFLVAFRHGDYQRYDGFRVTGSGADFHGVKVESNGAYEMTRLVLTAGRLADDESITPIRDWDAQAVLGALSQRGEDVDAVDGWSDAQAGAVSSFSPAHDDAPYSRSERAIWSRAGDSDHDGVLRACTRQCVGEVNAFTQTLLGARSSLNVIPRQRAPRAR